MSGGGGGGKPAERQTVIQDVPSWARPYYDDVLGKTKALSEQAYTPYGGQRLAQPNADLATSQAQLRSAVEQPIAGFEQAADTFGDIGQQAESLGRADPAQFNPYGGFQSGASMVDAYDFDPTRQFGGSEVDQYMSPYMDAVVGRQQDDAVLQFRRAQAGRDARAVNAGAFGGSRQAVQQGIAEEALSNQLGDIQATGQQRAFEQAQQQFERDRAAQMQTERQRAQELAREQGISVEEAARVQQGQAAEQARVQQSRADEAMRQREFQLQSLGMSADMAREVASLGERARAGDIQAAQLLEAQGLGNMAREQAGLDMAYEDFLRQSQYPQQQLGLYSDVLNRLPVQGAGTQTTTTPTNPMRDALGMGISAVGLSKALGQR